MSVPNPHVDDFFKGLIKEIRELEPVKVIEFDEPTKGGVVKISMYEVEID